MNASVAKKTQETLGKVIKKPPLTEKLLSKPPFRYLHDILSEVIRTTGFMKGLYGEAEMKSENVKDKDSKIAFLQKAIDVVMLVSGEPLTAKPARIVAGHEPEKTNEMLQAIAKCCLNKVSSDEAVRQVLAGDKVDGKGKASTSRSQGKENRESRERLPDREEKREVKESSMGTEQKGPDHKDPEGRRIEKGQQGDGERSEKAREKDRTKDRERDKDKARDRERDRDKQRDRNKGRERDKEREKTKERDLHKDKERELDKERERERRKERERERHKETAEKPKEKTDRKARATEEVSRLRPHLEESSKHHKANPAEPADASQNQPESPARIPRPSSAKGQRRWPKTGAQDESDSDGAADNPSVDKHVQLENGDASDIWPSHASHSSRRLARPSSARPAPPRLKRQESHTDGGPGERLGSAKVPSAVIVEGKKLSEDEEDEDGQFVVEEAAPPPTDMSELEMEPSVDLHGDEKHGGLVKKILETKKNFESPLSLNSKDQDRPPLVEAARRKDRELVAREIERLRASIQTVCRSALPLGKIMDYIQEDMDSMQNELHAWRRENKEHAQALLHEQRITDTAVEPLKVELAELDQLIKDQQDKICAVKSNIIKNEEKIHKMVSSMNFSSQT
ncbi:TRAF3-interacting protein 1 isoform X3 [Electrophorus electricus]|uniref:TRAF3-interacting protein 1 isoform X3 n=1 Tax=Electrophorus electricus TaxID=8005 RepID=UPI0015D02922|nr:TRAF3-interacting protein 1 isoform X3 [Electrophorus electricus]